MSMTDHPPLQEQDAITGAVSALTQATTGAQGRVVALTKGKPTVAIYNQSTVVSDAEVKAVAAALQTQVTRDFYPAWAVDATVIAVPKAGKPPVGAWVIAIGDDTSQAGALGWHDVDARNLPRGVVWAKTDKAYGLLWSVTCSHELLELLLDPYAVSCIFNQSSDTAGRLVPYEACDAVESDQAGYPINGVQVSDFILPAWFNVCLLRWKWEELTRFNVAPRRL